MDFTSMLDIAVITPYYNFCHYDKLRENYYTFRENVLKSTNELYTVELAYGDEPFELEGKRLWQYRTKSKLWYKENALQVGINKLLAKGFKKIVWCDADIIFTDSDWLQNIRRELQTHIIVQCFDAIEEHFMDRVQVGVGAMAKTLTDGKISGFAPGGVWAATNKFFERGHQLYQRAIVGGGDAILFLGCLPQHIIDNTVDGPYIGGYLPTSKLYSEKLYKNCCQWIDKNRRRVNSNAGFVRQKIECLPHGVVTNRNYSERHSLLHDVDPSNIKADNDGILYIERDELQQRISEYFMTRNDDSSSHPQTKSWHNLNCKGNDVKILGLAGKKGSGKNTVSNFLHGVEMVSLGILSHYNINEQGRLVVPAKFEDGVKEGVLDISNPITHPYLKESGLWQFIKQYSFADKLKQFCIDIFNLPYESCYGTDAQKNEPTQIRWSDIPGVIIGDAIKTVQCQDYNDFLLVNAACQKLNCAYIKEDGYLSGRQILQFFGTDIVRRMYNEAWVNATVKQIYKDKPLLAIVCDVRFPNEVAAIQKAGGRVIKLTRAPYADSHASEIELDKCTSFDYMLDNSKMDINEQNQAIYKLLKDWNWLQAEVTA